ncbi:MAG: hypothetical protein MK101_01595 [Phycisphaerales bacterium]|nr:hypothetical protein [Phycisphaerales bacterium]
MNTRLTIAGCSVVALSPVASGASLAARAASSSPDSGWILWVGIIVGVIGLFVILLPILRGLSMRFRMSMQRRKAVKTARRDLFLRSRLAEVARGGKEGEEAEPDVLSRRLDELKQDFIEGTGRLSSTGADARNRPWFILVGGPGSGRSTLMESSDLDLLDTEHTAAGSESQRLKWWFHSNGTILDPAGEVLRPEWGNRGAAEYRELLKWIRKDRSTPELRGIILAIEAHTLLGSDAALQSEINYLRGMLLDTVNVLGLDLPVYVLVTKCDEVEGLSSVMRSLSAGGQSRQIVGWSTQVRAGEPFARPELAEGMEALADRMGYVGESLLARSDLRIGSTEPEYFLRASRLFSLPDRIRKLGAGVTELCHAVFGEVSSLHNCSLRGVYLTAAEADKDDITGSNRTGRFIRDVFVEKIFRESTLARVSPSRFRKIYLTLVGSMAAVYAVLVLFMIGTFTSGVDLEKTARRINADWSIFESEIKNGGLDGAELIAANSDGSFRLTEDEQMPKANITRGQFLATAATAATERRTVPSAFRLTSIDMGTVRDDLLGTQRKLAFRSLFNPMLLRPLVAAAQESMRQSEIDWTPQATQAFADLLQLEQARVNFNSDWYYTFRFGAIDVGPMLTYVLTQGNSDSGLAPTIQGFEVGTGISKLLPDTDAYSLDAALISAGAGSRESTLAILHGMERYAKAWTRPEYLATMPLGQAEDAIKGILDFQAASKELEALAATLQAFTIRPPTEAQAKGVLVGWNAAMARATDANNLWRVNSNELKRGASELLVPMVERATREDEAALLKQFDMLLARTVVLRSAAGTGGSQMLRRIRQHLTNLQATVQQEQVKRSRALIAKARALDKTAWVVPKPPKPQPGALANAAPPAPVPPKLLASMQMDVLSQIDLRMNARPTGTVADFSSTLAEQVVASRNLSSVVTGALPALGPSQESKDFAKAAPMLTAMANWSAMYWAISNTIETLPQSSQEIATKVASEVSATSSWFRPGIPLTQQPDSGTFDGAYNPIAAAHVVAPWQRIKGMIDSVKSASELTGQGAATAAPTPDAAGASKVPTIPMLGQPQLTSKYNSRAASLRGYISLYVDYWARAMQASGQFAPIETWSDYQSSLATLRPFQVNSALQGYLQQVRLALQVGFLSEDTEEAAQAKALLTSINTQLTQLTAITTSSAQAAILRWQGLPDSASSARTQLLGLTIKQFTTRYFFLYTPGAKETIAYWDQLIMAGLESLSNSISQGAEQAISKVASTAFKWPVLNTGNHLDALSQAEINVLAGKIGSFYTGLKTSTDASNASAGASGAKAPSPGQQTILAGGTTGDPGIDYELARLRDGLLPSQGLAQGNVAAMPPTRTAAQRVGNVVMALASVPGPLSGTFIQPPIERTLMVPKMPTAQKFPVNGAMQYRYVEIWVDGTRVGNRVETMRGDGTQLERKDVQISAAATNLEIRFFRGVDDLAPGPVVHWSGSWALIDAYLNPQTDADQKTGIVWIPILFDNDFELECYWWFGLKLQRPLPQVANWPTPSDWPDNLLFGGSGGGAPEAAEGDSAGAPAELTTSPPATTDQANATGIGQGAPSSMTSPVIGTDAAKMANTPAQIGTQSASAPPGPATNAQAQPSAPPAGAPSTTAPPSSAESAAQSAGTEAAKTAATGGS